MISTASKKSKGRKLQQWVRDKILEFRDLLTVHDVRSTSMGASGMDIQLSNLARKNFPYAVECKSLKRCAVYKYYSQASENNEGLEPLVIIKANRQRPLAIIDAEYLLRVLLKPEEYFR